MTWLSSLRFRLIAIQIAVVLAGSGAMILVLRTIVPGRIAKILADLLVRLNLPTELSQQLLPELNREVSQLLVASVGIAALIAFLVGVGFSMLVWWIIITPIRNMAESSQRIAEGRYDERVEMPYRAGESISQLAINFNQMAQTLEDIEEQRVRLMGNVTHELRTPLSSLSGYVEGVMDGVFEPNDKLLRSLQKQINRMKRLVDDTQALSQTEAGAIDLESESIHVVDAINQVLYQLNPDAQEKNHSIKLHEPSHDIYVLGDYDRLTQVLLNLISNAINYTKPNGQIDCFVHSDNQACFITVQDNGIGIPADALPFIFERFYRADTSRSRKHGGSGVGLTISRNLARLMHGDLNAESDGIGYGSKFTLTLPLAS